MQSTTNTPSSPSTESSVSTSTSSIPPDINARNMLSPEFNDANDGAELAKMMGDEGEKLLDLVDKIRKIDSLRNEEIHIPQIVVIGDTSAGKSSVLQALTRLPFPVAGTLCTRFVTETTIRRCGISEKPGYKIEVKMDDSGTPQDAPFQPKTFESNVWAEVYQNLRIDLNDAFDKMSPRNLPQPRVLKKTKQSIHSTSFGPSQVPQLQKHRLQVTVRKQNQAHFSIVDIPGLVTNEIVPEDVRLSQELARRYIKNEEAIILAITPATTVMAMQTWPNLVREENARDRTIGVITKTDGIGEADHEITFDILRNHAGSEHHLKLGWFAVRNRSSKEILDGESFDERDRKETEFFESTFWKEATLNFPSWDSIDPKVLGAQSLKQSLQGHFYKRVKENFPRLRARMRSLQDDYNTKLRNMGDVRDKPSKQRSHLSKIQTVYETEAKRSLNGDYRFLDNPNHQSRLRYHVKTFNEKFELEIQQNGVKYQWQLDDNDDPKKGPGILNWINRTWDTHRGSEPRHDAPRSLKNELVKQQTESWESKARLYVQQVEDAIKACNDELFEFSCEDEALRQIIRKKLEVREMKAFEDAQAELANILQDCDYIESWNPQFDIFMKELQRPRMGRQVQREYQQERKSQATEGEFQVSQDQVLARELFYFSNKKIYDVHDWLFAYWKVAYPRFVDNVIIQVVERHLLGSKGPLRLFDRNWIVELTDEELRELAGESEETIAMRKELEERLDGLKMALEQADIAMRLKSVA